MRIVSDTDLYHYPSQRLKADVPMLIDLNQIPQDTGLEADICIVGAGAAGIAIALELETSGHSVLVIESGGFKADKFTRTLNEGEVGNPRLHSPVDHYRQRGLGGSTQIWGGRCMPFDPIDFEDRDYFPNAQWPIKFKDLAAYYPAANLLCEAGEFEYLATNCKEFKKSDMIQGFKSAHFTTHTLERFSCPTNFGTRYRRRLEQADNITLVLHANLQKILFSENSTTVCSIAIQSLQGLRATVKAQLFVLATGGLEVPRILLNCNETQRNGIGNQHDLVGRNYMCHLAGTIGELNLSAPSEHIIHGYEISEEGIYCRRRFALSALAQRKYKLGNFVARLHHPKIANPEHGNSVLSMLYLGGWAIPYEYRKRLYENEGINFQRLIGHMKNLASAPHEVTAFCYHLFRDRYLAERKFPSLIIHPKKPIFSLDFHAEQAPNPNSRITLTQATDQLGMRQLRVDWTYSNIDIETIRTSLSILAADFKDSAVGELKFDPESVELEATRYGAYGGHHIGTTRMGHSTRDSVVNSDCRIHSTDNLYIASASIFPTSSQANPTLTLVAIALRLSDHLTKRLGTG